MGAYKFRLIFLYQTWAKRDVVRGKDVVLLITLEAELPLWIFC